ncbi:HD-GYP domain-containing protein [Paenibacillus massiliensis]|uniref:HD-GYP domain-containing protein n=1 Tax=Paenibacillus massiliensis TaxID=225917 RepID=UPI00040BD86B|nr:HD-GYP domain-containing protein [Paenibacillus massiliensis]
MILKNVLDMLDPEHSKRVSVLSMDLARALKLSEREIELIGYGALYHDIGKISIPTSILESTSKLNEEDFKLMQRHVDYGLSILSVYTGEEMQAAQEIVASHHERWDGLGYPHGLMGEEIPLCGRIVSICDVFDALSSQRTYKADWPLGKVLDHVKSQRGTAFDPRLTDVFLEMVYEGAVV